MRCRRGRRRRRSARARSSPAAPPRRRARRSPRSACRASTRRRAASPRRRAPFGSASGRRPPRTWNGRLPGARSTTTLPVSATVRIGTCAWADKGLLEAWYPRGISTAEKRLRYYAERFDVVEVDSTYYALPDPAVTERWARRTPDGFTFHVKASAAMTWHEGEPTDQAFREFRAALEPLELSGKLRAGLLQYHPRFVKSAPPRAELARAPERLAPLVPLVEFRHRSWTEEAEREDTLSFLEENGLAFV